MSETIIIRRKNGDVEECTIRPIENVDDCLALQGMLTPDERICYHMRTKEEYENYEILLGVYNSREELIAQSGISVVDEVPEYASGATVISGTVPDAKTYDMGGSIVSSEYRGLRLQKILFNALIKLIEEKGERAVIISGCEPSNVPSAMNIFGSGMYLVGINRDFVTVPIKTAKTNEEGEVVETIEEKKLSSLVFETFMNISLSALRVDVEQLRREKEKISESFGRLKESIELRRSLSADDVEEIMHRKLFLSMSEADRSITLETPDGQIFLS